MKIAYSEKKNPTSLGAYRTGCAGRVELMMKDSKRFANTNGWDMARFVYDAKTDTFSAYGKDEKFVQECHGCHTIVKGADYVFTKYFMR
ncbi:MAG: cytochrome P460 family protein [Comamonadaceae bacterium]|nr:cytochrome P460 family protein [Comamonadaceae bacterium]